MPEPTPEELQQELDDLKALKRSAGWDLLKAQKNAMRRDFETWVSDQIDYTLPESMHGYGAMASKQGECRGRQALIDWVPARIEELEALLPPE